VIIPAFNEAESIVHVLGDIDRSVVNEIIVADNGSTDGTARASSARGARVVREDRRGYGWACLAAMARLDNPDIVVFLDGDYSDYPEKLPELIGPILHGEADFVIGSRTLGRAEKGALTPPQRFGNWLSSRLLNLVLGASFNDLGPFRAIKWDLLRKLGMKDKRFGWTIEMQIRAVLLGARIVEVPVPYRKRIHGKSKVSGTVKGVVLAGFYILYYVGLAAVKRLTKRRPGD